MSRAYRRPSATEDHEHKVIALSTESIASQTQKAQGTATQCALCGTLLASDQRYCLECGERRAPISEFLLGRTAENRVSDQQGRVSPPSSPGLLPADGGTPHSNTPSVIAGVGVLLLAMGVGILIGRSGNGKQAAAPAPQVISVAGPATGSSGVVSNEAAFTDDWSSGISGYTVQLQALPKAGTSIQAVEAAKTTATSKGAKAVGALKSEDFSSLVAGSYVVYSGVFHSRAAAASALPTLKKNFPSAKVISVSNHRANAAANGSSGGSGSGASVTHPAPASALESLAKAKGKNYEEKSKNLPDVVSTG